MKRIPSLTETDKLDFLSRVNTGDIDECWEWQGSRFQRGYGRWYCHGITLRSHRVSYYLVSGSDPGDKLVCHTCDNPGCCNPGHLFLGTDKDNQVDCARKGRARRGENNAQHKLTETEVQYILSSKLSHRTLASKLSVGVTCITRVRHKNTWNHIPTVSAWKSPFIGSGLRKLTQEQVKIIRTSSLGVSELGRLLGVSHSVVSRVRSGHSYKSV